MSQPKKQLMTAKGVYPILPTPFLEDGALDIESIRRLIDYQKTTGVSGVAVLGFMGEADKLSQAERSTALLTAANQANGDLDIWVGIRALGTMGAVEYAQIAEAHGASLVFVAPISVQNDNVLYDHFQQVQQAVSIPVMIHDYPTAFNVTLSPDLIARLGKDKICPYIKLEDTPVGPKMTKVRALAGDEMGVFGGLGGFYFMEEMERGALGIASGFTFSEVLVRIYDLYTAGDYEEAAKTFDHYASLIRYEFQPGLGLAFRKHIYQRRGIFRTNVVRKPIGMALDPYTAMEYERVIARCGLSLEI